MRTRLLLPNFISQSLICTLLLFLAIIPATAQVLQPTFDVATVKMAPQADPSTGTWSLPGIGQFTATHVSLALLIQLAYGVDGSQIANKPSWVDTELYDVVAKPEEGVKLSRDELKPRLQQLLRQRFHLMVHTETRPTRGYALLVAKGGPHLTPTKADHFPGFRSNVSPGQMYGFNWSMPIFAKYLTSAAGFPVVDQTGIAGSYDIGFSYQPEIEGANPQSSTDGNLKPLEPALKDSTGLILKPQSVPVETIVIDSADKIPTPN